MSRRPPRRRAGPRPAGRPRARLHPDRRLVGGAYRPSSGLASRSSPSTFPVTAARRMPGRLGHRPKRPTRSGEHRWAAPPTSATRSVAAAVCTSRSSSPTLVERLVVVGAQPGHRRRDAAATPPRGRRALADETRARRRRRRARASSSLARRAAFRPPDEEQADRASRLSNTAAGLAASLRTAGTGTQAPLWDRLGELEMPVLVVVGASDDKFRPIASGTAEAIGPNARLGVMAGRRARRLLRASRAFVTLLREFLAAGT